MLQKFHYYLIFIYFILLYKILLNKQNNESKKVKLKRKFKLNNLI